MRRRIDRELIQWKNSENRKPLVIKGARQVGKTYTTLSFGGSEFAQVVHIDFAKQPEAKEFFAASLDPHLIVRNIERDREIHIEAASTLLFFDEIQLCEDALTSLKYFCEDAPEYYVVAAGSLLGVRISRNRGSYPVGKTVSLTMHPLDFEEYLWALGRDQLAEAIHEHYQSDEAFALHDTALGYYRDYLLVGGMPEVVQQFVNSSSFEAVRLVQDAIVTDYVADMTKYTDGSEGARVHATWQSLPVQLAKENTKFQYSAINQNARARSFSSALDWLLAAGIITRATQVTEGLSPLKAFEKPDNFKVYYEDTGLLSAAYGAGLSDINDKGAKTARFRGGLVENYVMQQLSARDTAVYYWGMASKAEIDFVIQTHAHEVIPLEVKSGSKVSSVSLNLYRKKYDPVFAIRLSTKNFGFEGGIKNVPLYAAWCIGGEVLGSIAVSNLERPEQPSTSLDAKREKL